MGRGESTLLVHNPKALRPDGGIHVLSVMTFNVLHAGLRREALDAWFLDAEETGRLPDVLAIQETNLPLSVTLARRFRYHLAYYGREQQPGLRYVNGKAILSRLPVLGATHFIYAIDAEDRRLALQRHVDSFESGPGELDEDRGVLRATLRLGRRRVDVYTLHHTLGDAAMNAAQLRQLHRLIEDRARTPAVVAGDFNANLNIVEEHGAARPGKQTRSVEAYRNRYGHLPTGRPDNAHDPRVRAGLRALFELTPDTFERAPTFVRLPGVPRMSPEQARRRLLRGDIPRDTEAHWRLQDIADGATLALDVIVGPALPASGKRFDGILAAKPWRALEVEIDRVSEASDHTPMRVVLER
jgi:endonuclease/exonuclease/phosphatase family metal-dependent hydrolase